MELISCLIRAPSSPASVAYLTKSFLMPLTRSVGLYAVFFSLLTKL